MDKQDVARVKRGLTKKKCSIDRVVAYYMTAGKKGTFINPQFMFLSEDEAALYLALLSKALSGKLGSNLTEYRITGLDKVQRLDNLRRGTKHTIEDISPEDETEESFLSSVAESYICDTDFCILLGYGTFDIETYAENAQGFIICSICPCTPDKNALAFDSSEKMLRDRLKDIPISSACNGFLYPAYENGEPDLQKVLYYTKKKDPIQTALTDSLFGVMETVDEKEVLNGILAKNEKPSLFRILDLYSNAASFLETAPDGVIDIPSMAQILERSGITASDKIQEIKDRIPTGKFSSFTENGALVLKSQDFQLKIPMFKTDDIKLKNQDGATYLMMRVDLGDIVDVNGLQSKLGE